jgi:hypothetical protein
MSVFEPNNPIKYVKNVKLKNLKFWFSKSVGNWTEE